MVDPDLLEMYKSTHSKDLTCVEGYVLRRREWDVAGRAGRFDGECPYPSSCKIPARTNRQGEPLWELKRG